MSELLELAAKCEQATGPDRSIDYAIEPLIVIAGQEPPFGIAIPAYTASLDAAMTLVPEGWAYRIENWPRPDGQADIASDGGPSAKAVLMECLEKRIGKQAVWGFHTPGSKSFETRAVTPALALCAAALRARASLDIDVGEGK